MIYRKIKGKPDLDHNFYFQLYNKFPLYKSFLPFFDTFLTDKHAARNVSKNRLLAYLTLLMYLVPSSLLKFLCLRLFDNFWPTERSSEFKNTYPVEVKVFSTSKTIPKPHHHVVWHGIYVDLEVVDMVSELGSRQFWR